MFKNLCGGLHNNLNLTNIDDLVNPNAEFYKENKIDIELWNGHDWKNLYAFKDHDTWLNFQHCLIDLVNFYNNFYKKNHEFKIFFKSYAKHNIEKLKEDAGRCVSGYWDDILEVANEGYVFMFFTTQRECHDCNQFLGYMLDNFLYERDNTGHMTWNDTKEDDSFLPIITNEKW